MTLFLLHVHTTYGERYTRLQLRTQEYRLCRQTTQYLDN